MTGVAMNGLNLTERETGLSFQEVWGMEPPPTFDKVHEAELLLVNRMVWIIAEEEKETHTVRERTESLNTVTQGPESHAAGREIAAAMACLERVRARRHQADCDVVQMFSVRNPFRSRDIFMRKVDRTLVQQSRRS
ncbi:MAG: hypothetical protein Q7R48_00125 [bacterium]|nr:hypothetical protein [bacterium]